MLTSRAPGAPGATGGGGAGGAVDGPGDAGSVEGTGRAVSGLSSKSKMLAGAVAGDGAGFGDKTGDGSAAVTLQMPQIAR
jgi:hypothetical protein